MASDGELIQAWEPGQPAHYLVMRFNDPEDMIRTQERVTKEMNGRADDGERREGVETITMTYGQVGCRQLMDGRVTTYLVVTTDTAEKETDAARRAWAHEHMLSVAPALANMKLSEGWTPTMEQQDWFDKWCEEVIELDPAGVDGGTRRKTGWVRGGFNLFVTENQRPDLRFLGSSGGRGFSALIQSRYKEAVEVRYQGSNAYYHGLRARADAKQDWFLSPNGT